MEVDWVGKALEEGRRGGKGLRLHWLVFGFPLFSFYCNHSICVTHMK